MAHPKVLVIDDEEISRISCARVLMRVGIETMKAASGREGLELLVRNPPDVVLVDLKMPEMDGMEVARRIRDYDPTIVAIIITGYATIETAVSAIKQGAYDYLPKPFTADELVIVVQRGLEKRRLDRESRALREEKETMERNFVTMVTHQLRSPLGAIAQYFEVLLGDHGGTLSDSQREMIERAQVRLEGLLHLINDWLDMSRLQAGEILHRLRPCPLQPSVNAALSVLRITAHEKGVNLEVNLPDDLPEVLIDPETFGEALSNLIANAIKYNRPEGKVSIRASAKNGGVVVAIADTGLGVDEKELPFIFEQFYRGKAKEVRQQQGTGLGLTIALKIVRAHGGKIEVQSRLGEGTTFSVHLDQAREGEK